MFDIVLAQFFFDTVLAQLRKRFFVLFSQKRVFFFPIVGVVV
jgi:hypothetical protein